MGDPLVSKSVILAEEHVLSPRPVVGVARRPRRELLISLAHPPLSDRRFWLAQVFVGVVWLIHFIADQAQDRGIIHAPGFVWTLLLLFPIIYAGMIFGLVGSLGTALLGIAALAPTETFLAHSSTELWGAWSILAMELAVAVVLGDRYEQTWANAQTVAKSEEMVHSEARFRLAFDIDMAGMVLEDLQGRVLRVNRALCEMLGRREEELVGAHCREFVHVEDRALSEQMDRQLMTGEVDQQRLTKRCVHRDGGVVFVEISRSLARDQTGAPSFIITSIRDVTEERILSDQLSHQALHDPMTGLPNRALLQDRVVMARDRSLRDGRLSALFMLDLDDFKGVNDTFGHQIGDQLLIALARRLEKATRAQDTLCRFGGDEFIYLAEGLCDESDIEEIVSRLRGVFIEPFLIDGFTIEESASIGVATSSAGNDVQYAELVQNADIALYEAKRRGRTRHVVFTPAMSEQVSDRFTLTQELGHALARGEIALHYQPIVDLTSGVVVGFEALMRWHHAEFGLIPPDVFIGFAEQSNLILALGAFALGEATMAAASWRAGPLGGAPPFVAVNLSPRQFHDPSLLTIIEEALATSQLAPNRLLLEITEGVALFDIDSAVRVIERLRQLNVVVALDDFGTGYSSLSYVTRLRPQIIKIDRSFLVSATIDSSAEQLLEAMVRLCRGLDIVALVEGVEAYEQLALLIDLGCELGQGYLFAPARGPNEVEASHDLVRRSWEQRSGVVLEGLGQSAKD